MTNAQNEQIKFWSIFDNKLIENGEPFTICYEHTGTTRFFGTVNKKRARTSLAIVVEFLYRYSVVKLNIYIENDVRLFDYLHSKRTQIEEELGFKPEWIFSGSKNPNTRRIINEFPVKIGDPDDYDRVIDKMLPYIMQYKKVFEKYIPNLCDF